MGRTDSDSWFQTELAAIEERIARTHGADVLDGLPSDERGRRYRHLVENSLGLICSHDLEGRLLSVNPAAAHSLGYEVQDGIGRNLREFLSPGTRHLFDVYLQRIRQHSADSGVMRVVRKDGTERLWLYRNVLYAEPGMVPYVLGHALDITDRVAAETALRAAHDELEKRVAERTAELVHANEALRAESEERRRLEQQLIEAQTLEATGRLAGGVAHVFNNLLTVVLGGSELLRNSVSHDAAANATLDEIMRAASRGAALTSQLLAAGGRQISDPEVLDLNAIVSRLDRLLRRLLGPTRDLLLQLDPSIPPIVGDAAQIEQALLNLVANARDAMPDGGTVTIQTASVAPGTVVGHDDPKTASGTEVLLTVKDTGCGMDVFTRTHMFEPFFTTKSFGTGTGLGLPVVHGIIHQHGGSISVESEPGHGATFTILLPRAVSVGGAHARRVRAVKGSSGGTETILLVEDEEEVRSLMRMALTQKGYTVLEAATGVEALRLLGGEPRPIDLLLTDIIMPGMSGRELQEIVASLQPGAKVLFVSGHTDDALLRVPNLKAAFLPKPFRLEALIRKVRHVLDERD
jgi:PAS domain S-box-containing protein